ncbi:MAG: YndJ family transporter [Acidobacteria bacterium]|nr:YndJ family transporter [Acidobacteriota bacterium]
MKTTAFGSLIWLVTFVPLFMTGNLYFQVTALLFSAFFIWVPLALRLSGDSNKWIFWAGFAQIATLWIPDPGWRLMVSLPYLACWIQTLLLTFNDLRRLLALGFGMVGALFWGVSQLRVPLFGFSPAIILLTAVHYHFAGFAVVTLMRLSSGISNILFWGYGLSVVAVALGITMGAHYELIPTLILCVFLVRFSMHFCQHYRSILAKLSAVSLGLGLALAVAYAYGQLVGMSVMSWKAMVQSHGIFQSLGFVGCGYLHFLRHASKPASPVVKL